jgi:NAD-dependent SIR2 family protein deacetylase
MTDLSNDIKIQTIIRDADALLIFAGAGIGHDSGLPVFRDNEGLWNAYPALAQLQLNFHQIANPVAFTKHPVEANAFYLHRQALYQQTTPHLGFDLLLHYGKQCKEKYFVVTSNVDGHFLKAGFDSTHIYEAHGNIHHWQCTDYFCAKKHGAHPLSYFHVKGDDHQTVMYCPACQAFARPNLLMFGDGNWASTKYDQQQENYLEYLTQHQYDNVAVLEIGAGTAVDTMRSMALDAALRCRTKVIRINPVDTQLHTTEAHCYLTMKATAKNALEQILPLSKHNKSHPS